MSSSTSPEEATASSIEASSPPPPLVDVDCNLWHKDLQPLLPLENSSDGPSEFSILKQDAIRQANIVAMLSPSSTLAEAERGISLLKDLHSSEETASSLPRIRTTVGVHPYHVNDDGPSFSEQMETCAQLLLSEQGSAIVAAVGECGLDASEGFPPLQDQIPWFQAQIALAERFRLPLFVHERLAHAQTMDLLSTTTVPVLIHCFTGTVDELRAYVERGYYVSFSGYICKEDLDATLECLTTKDILPLDRLMIETDAPYMGFAGCRDLYLSQHAEAIAALKAKKRKRLTASYYPNVPSSLPRVLDSVLEAINQGWSEPLTRDELAWTTSRNANRFFQFRVPELEE
jgi:TatD DNase family protein